MHLTFSTKYLIYQTTHGRQDGDEFPVATSSLSNTGSSRIAVSPSELQDFISLHTVFCEALGTPQARQIAGPTFTEVGGSCAIIRLDGPVFNCSLDRGLISNGCCPRELALLKRRFRSRRGQ